MFAYFPPYWDNFLSSLINLVCVSDPLGPRIEVFLGNSQKADAPLLTLKCSLDWVKCAVLYEKYLKTAKMEFKYGCILLYFNSNITCISSLKEKLNLTVNCGNFFLLGMWKYSSKWKSAKSTNWQKWALGKVSLLKICIIQWQE